MKTIQAIRVVQIILRNIKQTSKEQFCPRAFCQFFFVRHLLLICESGQSCWAKTYHTVKIWPSDKWRVWELLCGATVLPSCRGTRVYSGRGRPALLTAPPGKPFCQDGYLKPSGGPFINWRHGSHLNFNKKQSYYTLTKIESAWISEAQVGHGEEAEAITVIQAAFSLDVSFYWTAAGPDKMLWGEWRCRAALTGREGGNRSDYQPDCKEISRPDQETRPLPTSVPLHSPLPHISMWAAATSNHSLQTTFLTGFLKSSLQLKANLIFG